MANYTDIMRQAMAARQGYGGGVSVIGAERGGAGANPHDLWAAQDLAKQKAAADIDLTKADTEVKQASAEVLRKDPEDTALAKEQLKGEKLKNISYGLKNAVSFLPTVTRDNYDDFHSWITESNFVPSGTFKTPAEIKNMTPLEFKAYKSDLSGLKQLDAKDLEVLRKQHEDEIKAKERAEDRKYTNSLTIDLYNPKTDKTVEVKRGSDDYNAFLEIGYEEGIPGKKDEAQTSEEAPGATPIESNPIITAEEARKGVGALAAAKQFVNNTIGQFVPGQIFPETEEAKNKLRSLNQILKPYYQVSRAGAKFDVDNIDKMLVNPDAWFTDPDSAKAKFDNLYNITEASIQAKRSLWQTADAKQKKELASDIINLQESLSILPKPGQQRGNNFSNLSVDEIKSIDTTTLSAEERAALNERVDQLLRER